MEVSVRHLEGVRFDAEARGHHIISDQPLENGGADNGMTPPELMLAALGSCAAYYAAEYLRMRSLSLEGLTVHVQAEKATKPARLSAFRIRVQAPYVNPSHYEMLYRSVKHCLIHNTLLSPPEITLTIETSGQLNAA